MLVVVFVVLLGGLYLYFKDKNFNVKQIQTMLDKANSMAGQTPIAWSVKDDYVEGYLQINDTSYLKYLLNETSIYSETNFITLGDELSKLPCLDFVPIFNQEELKRIYKEILHQDIKAHTKKEIQVSDHLYLFYSYKQEKNTTNVVCKVFYRK